MSARYLSDDWFAAVAALGAELPEIDGLDAVVDIEVAGSPDGKVRYHEVWNSGRLVEVASGKAEASDVQFVFKYPDAVAHVRGDIADDVAFMQGRFKIDGAYERWLYEFRPVVGSESYRAFRESVAQSTDFD